jgi:hypothetical protein
MSKIYTAAFAWLSVLFLLGFCASEEVRADDPKPEEIVAKHLDSIGTKEKRATVKNQMAAGTGQFSVLRSSVNTKGKRPVGGAVFLSEASKIFIGAKYDVIEYPFDEIVYNAKNVGVPFDSSGNRPILGNIILSHSYLVSEGLLGGSITTAWSLFNLESHQAKLKSGGKKKVNGRQAYVINYLVKGGSSFTIKLFFDAENFQHIRSEYQQVFAAPMGPTMRDSAQQNQTIQRLTEEFSNFKTVDGLTLPYSYRINYLNEGNRNNEFEWSFEFKEYLHNQKIDAASFEMKQN